MPETRKRALSMLLLQLEQVTVAWPEAGTLPSLRSAEMEMPSTLISNLPLTLLKEDTETAWSKPFFPYYVHTPVPGSSLTGFLLQVSQELWKAQAVCPRSPSN